MAEPGVASIIQQLFWAVSLEWWFALSPAAAVFDNSLGSSTPEFNAQFIVWRCIVSFVCNVGRKVTKKAEKRLVYWQQLPFAFCVRPDVTESRRLAGLEAGYVVEMRADSPTLIRELECSDKAEYWCMFRTDVDSFKLCDAI